MQRKILITGFRILATLLLLLSFLSIVLVHISDKGDIIDRNSGWILFAFIIALGLFVYSVSISDVLPKGTHKKKTIDELMNEIKKPNLDKLKNRNK